MSQFLKPISFALILSAVLICTGCEPKPQPTKPAVKAVDPEAGFVPLFNGKDLSAFTPVKAPANIWSVTDGVIQCKGMPFGWLATKKSYRNYTLRLEFRYPKQAGNSGIFLHAVNGGKKWPKCIEVQGKFDQVCKVFGLGGTKGKPVFGDDVARKRVSKPHTEWNAIEIIMNEGAVTATLNGTLISQTAPFDIKQGPIALQSEGAPIEFRKIRIKETK